ncbi:MAG TPA: hypothetical protein VG742_11760 [Dongiaceae bacterium]|nr:hypothetical protein [Dongiaceae bacterium]
MQRLFAPKKRQRRSGLSFILFAFTFLCVIGAASFVALLGIRSGLIKSAAPQMRDLALDIGILDTSACVVDSLNRLDCSTGAVGTPIRFALGKMREMEEQLAREQALRIAAEEKAKAATEALARIADSMQATQQLQAAVGRPGSAAQPYVMLPGDVVQPFAKRMTLVYRQPVGTDKVLLGSDLWNGDREMEFYKPYRAAIGQNGERTEFDLVVSPAPDWNQGDRSIRLELKPQAEAEAEPAAPTVLAPE